MIPTRLWLLFPVVSLCALAQVQPPDSLVLDGIPAVSEELRERAGRYTEFRAASFCSWHPKRRELLIATRFSETMQLHLVESPMGMRRQLTFSGEPITSGTFEPGGGSFIVYSQDQGGGEFYQLYRFDPQDGKSTLLTDGKSRNMGARWARSGRWIAYTSTRRNGRDTDIYVIDPANPKSNRLIQEVNGGGWRVEDWSRDETRLLIQNYISINQSELYLLDLRTGTSSRLTGSSGRLVAYGQAAFSRDDRSVLVTSDEGSEFKQLLEFDLPNNGSVFAPAKRLLTGNIPWDIDEFELSEDGSKIAFVANENGAGVLHVMHFRSGKELKLPEIPRGIVSNVRWHENNRDLGFNVTSARSPSDVYSLDTRSGRVDRWTASELGGVSATTLAEPELVRFKSFDGRVISAFVYRPDPRKFPGVRPALIIIHGGPESQSRPGFMARNNYYTSELGITVVVPNVRGSSGYGKTFLALDNGFHREDSVRDIGALLDWLGQDAGINAQRVGVMGGSYGGYMVLASMAMYSDRLSCGVDIVGISNFLTFLKNTQEYRRDLRRAEYGDEREPAMATFLDRISPTTRVKAITKPLLVVQGKNDPRVPVTEAEQMVKAIRGTGGTAWYLMAQDEGHGFAKKRNADFQFLTTIRFLEEYLIR